MEGWRQSLRKRAMGHSIEFEQKSPVHIGPPSFLAEWWQSGPRRQGFARAAQNAPLTAPGRSENPPLGRKVDFRKARAKARAKPEIYLTSTGILMEAFTPTTRLLVKWGILRPQSFCGSAQFHTVVGQFEPTQMIYLESRSAVWSSNQKAPPNGLWLAKSGTGSK